MFLYYFILFIFFSKNSKNIINNILNNIFMKISISIHTYKYVYHSRNNK